MKAESATQPRLSRHLAEPQHRNASYLLLSQLLGAATGVLFWLLFARLVPHDAIGVGGAIVLGGTAIGVLAKGGFDTALVRSVPATSSREAKALFGFAVAVAAGIAVLLTALIAVVASGTHAVPGLAAGAWWLVGAIAVLLVVTWLQDAYFIAERDARYAFRRNVVLSAARLALPIPLVLLAFASPIATTWALALACSAAAALLFMGRIPLRTGPPLPRSVFMRRSSRNFMGGAAEFLPGLLLVPMILVLSGPAPAGHFMIAWSAASLLFVASAAMGRSALAELSRDASADPGNVIRRGALQHVVLLLPAALVGILLAPHIMGIFGAEYARESALPFMLLCASILFVAPSYLYLSVLRAQDRALPLIVFPFALLAAIFVLVPILEARYALWGVSLAWLLANVPFGAYAAWRLSRHIREVRPDAGLAATS